MLVATTGSVIAWDPREKLKPKRRRKEGIIQKKRKKEEEEENKYYKTPEQLFHCCRKKKLLYAFFRNSILTLFLFEEINGEHQRSPLASESAAVLWICSLISMGALKFILYSPL